MIMDLAPFKLDIDELLDEFTEGNLITLTDFKRVWAARKFSYIYEARPTTNSAFFMQSLFSYCICNIVSQAPLARRLGGLYCLYCLHQTQPYKPSFKIYLSLDELRRLRKLVIDAKENGIKVVIALVKRMLVMNMFLFGSVDIAGGSVTQRVEEITKLQNKHIQIACEKLLSNTRIEDFLHMDLGAEMELKALKKMSEEYDNAKELAIKEASQKVEVQDIKHIGENKKLVGNTVKEIVDEWDAQKEMFYKQTGISQRNEVALVDDFDELEHLLNE
ncbi:snRNA-activating protein complex subunit 1 protein [Dioscorea alata]|uniref:snRNA-activating protein complex subunit 1 protein n=2 Tax=Dioscorea alata TaxID=55571 RepID=A0ACB7W5T7_DIOAL|nr:snRNA-activating protein complex subunit 1 protein [Dioscorea alata]KAH7682956.1 snRNA-activating protein complex subunit 1 protein [Dioscorea alata]